MNLEYKKYPPKEIYIYISILGRETTEEERWHGAQGGVVYNKGTGYEFLDLFAAMVNRYMNHDIQFYAKKLGITSAELSSCLKVLTGLKGDEWICEYRWLAIRELLLQTDWTMGQVAKRTGYSTVKTFSRAFIDRIGVPPSHWRSRYKKKTDG